MALPPLSRTFLSDINARRWAALYDVASEGFAWDQRAVEERLEAAMLLLRRVGGAYGPKVFGAAWPAVEKDIAEAPRRNEAPPMIAAGEVAALEAAMVWPTRFLGQFQGRRRPHQEQLSVLQLWLRAKATGRPFKAGLDARNIVGRIGYRRKSQALLLIATGLMEAGEPVPVGRDGGAPSAPAQAPVLPVEDDPDGATAPSALWEAVAAALARRRAYECPKLLVNRLLAAHVRAEFAGLPAGQRLGREMDTRGRQLRVLARRRGFLANGGPPAGRVL